MSDKVSNKDLRLEEVLKEKYEDSGTILDDRIAWKTNIGKTYLFQFLISFHLIAGVIIPFYTQWGKLTFFQIMCLESYFMVMVLIFEIPCGAIADYVNKRASLILGGIANTIAVIFYSSYANIISFIIGETLWAFSTALISGTDQALIYDNLERLGKEHKINKKVATLHSAILAAIFISAPLGSIIGELVSIQFSVFLMIIPFLFSALVALTLKKPKKFLNIKERATYRQIVISGFSELKTKKSLRILAFEYVFVEIIVFFLIWTYQPYLERINIPLIYYGFVFAAMTASQVFFVNLIPKLETHIIKKKKKKKVVIQMYTIIPGICFVLLGLTSLKSLGIFLILIIVGFGFSRKIFFVEAINKQIPTEKRTTVFSTINMFGSLLQAIFYPIIGVLVSLGLSYTFVILGIIVLLDALLMKIQNSYF